jgi:tyrosine-protein kinase Etk/Wzc
MAIPGERPELNVVGTHPQPPSLAPLGGGDPGQEAGNISLAFYLNLLWEGRWLIAASLAAAALGLVAYLTLATPIFESDVLLQIDERRQGAAAEAFSDLPTALAGPERRVDTEIEVLQSRRLLGSVVDALNLDVSVTPVRAGDAVLVSRFEVPVELVNRTVSLVLVAGADGKFEVRSDAGKAIASGEVGQAVTWKLAVPGGEGTATLFLQELRARPGTDFSLKKISRNRSIQRLRDSLRFAEKGRKTGVIRVSIEGPDPELLVSTLDTLTKAYLRYNLERRSDEAQRTLEFLDTQIPTLRVELHAAEAALEKYRMKAGGGGVDLSASTKATLDRTVEMEKRLSEMKLQRKELLYRFTDTHPAVLAVDDKVNQLRAERETLNEQIRQLPEAEAVSLRLMRDVKVANELYVTLLNKAQELKVLKSGFVGNAHFLDLPVLAETPISPDKPRSAIIALLAGLFLGVALAFARKALHRGLVDPADAERATGLPVRASIPHSDRQAALLGENKERGGGPVPILAALEPTDMAAEALRALRTSLQFALLESANHVVAIGSPRPGVGKSFVTVNLARVFADAGKRVLLLDADLRIGSLHAYMGVERTPGLAEAIAGTVPVAEVLRKTELPGIDFISRGATPSNPSELLGSQRFREMVESLSVGYDIVLVDLPPILAVTDAALVGRFAGVNLLVIRAAWHPIRELQLAVKGYAENGVRLSGLVFNDVPKGKGGPGGYAYQYSYQYSYKARDEK